MNKQVWDAKKGEWLVVVQTPPPINPEPKVYTGQYL